MADDWDLSAIIKSCSSASATTVNTSKTDTAAVENGGYENGLECLTFGDDDGPFSFSDFGQARNNGWEELQDSYKPFLPISRNHGNIPISPINHFGEFLISGQNDPQLAPPLPPPPPPVPPPMSAPFNLSFDSIDQEPRQSQKLHQQSRPIPVISLRTAQSVPASRSRKKKGHLKKQVMQVAAENLSNDVWAWRKYGQKPIKGSPFPRNYYRCSSTKGCGARKQVERSNIDPAMFIVSYTGDHSHPRPTHRNSLAGSTRNKFPTLQKANSDDLEKLGACSSSPLSGTSLSPTTPLSAASMDHEVATAPAKESIMKPEDQGHRMESDGGDDDDYFGDDILIPNLTLNEDLLKDLHELNSAGQGAFGGGNRTGGLGQSLDFGDSFSSWVVGSSAAAAGATRGGGL
ncbi:probable WRKY transcription factor 27 [Mercurialis annua]|uniref:probable WRKY transcription factor 27 n=1 Tax=Mercurialis annua TaxID=3986 RepID=UPI002160BB93|nr:probable WRKY transcription factor 27 [Mercurialis annua]